jgi:hypothetical protein
VLTFADKGYQGADCTIGTPFKRHPPTAAVSSAEAGQPLPRVSAASANARSPRSGGWKILTKLRCCARRTTAIVQAILGLHAVEADRYSR